MLIYLEDMFYAIQETLELIKEEAELKSDETQIETARSLEEVNNNLNRIYGRLWRASIFAEDDDFIQGRDDQEVTDDGCE